MAVDIHAPRAADVHDPTWQVALLFPAQGCWNDSDYLALDTNRLVELTDGTLEIPPMPSDRHQAILAFLFLIWSAVSREGGGSVRMAPLPLRLGDRRYREPDLMVLHRSDDPRRQATCWTGADLVLEVVSPDDPDRDLVVKRREYAEAGIPEYWIVNPLAEEIVVLRLAGERYAVHGRFGRGTQATSATIAGLIVDVSDALDAA